jgi:hypothetical protein
MESNAPLVADVLAEVREAIRTTQRIMIAKEPKHIVLDTVEVTLQTVLTEESGVGLKFKIPFLAEKENAGGAGVDASETRTHTQVVTLVPDDKVIYKLHDDEEPTVSDVLVGALLDIREIARQAAMGEPRFDLQSSTFEVKFGVKRGGSLSVVLADTAFARETVQTIKISLKNRNVDLPPEG